MNIFSHTQITIPRIDTIGHGYLKISSYDLRNFGISLKEFSEYSYYDLKSGTAYLEEDCDALKLFKLLKEKNVMVNVTDGGVDENLTNGKVRLSSRALAMNHGVQ